MGKKKGSHSKKQKPEKRRAREKFSEELYEDMDGDFSFIAGYTDGGVPYGVTWEEVGIDSDLPFLEKALRYFEEMGEDFSFLEKAKKELKRGQEELESVPDWEEDEDLDVVLKPGWVEEDELKDDEKGRHGDATEQLGEQALDLDEEEEDWIEIPDDLPFI